MPDLDTIIASWREILDIGIVAFIFYQTILFVRGTRAVSVIYGLLLVVLAHHVSEELGLVTLNWLLTNFLASLFLVVVILFQRDLRTALARVGAGGLWKRTRLKVEVLDELAAALMAMARARVGALVVLERGMPLGDILKGGVSLDARLSRELLETIFHPGSPLHDGAAVVRGSRVLAAGCILPLSAVGRGESFGTRHRAGLGLTEESDALALIVSEERGVVSLAEGGRLVRDLDEDRLKVELARLWRC